MSRNVQKMGHRLLAGLLSLICLISVMSQALPTAYAAEGDPGNYIKMYFTDSDGATISEDGAHADYTIPDTKQQIVEIELRIEINYAIKAGDLTIRIPMAAFGKRNGSGGFEANSDALNKLLPLMTENWTIVNMHENTSGYIKDGYLEITNKEFSSYQGSFALRYDVNPFDVEDGSSHTFDIKVDDKTDSFETPDPIEATFDTHVDYGSLSKTVSDNYAPNGCYNEWDDSLEKRFPGLFESKDDFNAQCADNYFVCYLISPSVMNTNQPCAIYIDETPEYGEVLAVSRMQGTQLSGGTPLEKVAAPVIPGADFTYERDVWKDSWKGGLSPSYFALVRYPKDPGNGNEYDTSDDGGAIFNNTASLALVGDDHPEKPDTAYYSRNMSSIWQEASAGDPGDIWGLTKKAHADPMGALNILRNGKDITLGYDISAVGLTYKYVGDKDFEKANSNDYADYNGSYRLELVDDALYVNGLGENGLNTARLLPEDFHFKTFTLEVKHDVVEEVDLKLEIRKSHPMPFEDRVPVEVWVMTEASGNEWVLDQTIENIAYVGDNGHPSESRYADEDNNTVFKFAKADEGVYRIKFVYNNANGRVVLSSTVTGVLRGEGSTVQRVLANIEEKNIENFQLFNWDAETGYNVNGKWEDPVDSDSITTSAPEMKDDLLDLEAELYDGHTRDRISHRQVAQNNLKEAQFFSGAGKQLLKNTWTSDSVLDLQYYIAAVEGAGAPTAENLEELVEMGAVEAPREIVFHELLPIGVNLVSVEPVTLRGQSGVNWVVFNKDEFNWDNSFATQYQGGIQSQVSLENAPEVSYEIEDIYVPDGIRQMVTITVRYSDDVLPVVQFGLMGSVYGLGTVLQINCIAKVFDIKETVKNDFAAHFVDSEGSTIVLEGGTVYPDDGSVFEEITDKDGNSVFEDVDGDGDTESTTVVGASNSYVEKSRYTDTQLIKWIKEDQLDTYFKKYTQTYAGHDYTYKIQFYTNDGTVKNVVIFDSIEQAFGYDEENPDRHPQIYDDNRHWKGTLRGIDLTEAEYAGFDKIRVYVNKEKFYSDAEMASTGNNDGLTAQDLIAGKDGWEEVEREEYETYDWENVKTIAFSIGKDQYFGNDFVDSDGVLHENLPSTVSVYLKMTAPDTIPEEQTATEQVLAYNNPGYYKEIVGSNLKQTTVANTVTIGMKSAEAAMPAVSKTVEGSELYEGFEETFKFGIKPLNGAPAPKAYNNGEWGTVISEIGIVLNADTPTAIANNTGRLLFTEPGVFEYEIYEKASDGAGITYSGAKYKVVFTVTDEREINGEVPQYAENTELDVDMKIYRTHDEDGKALAEAIEAESIEFVNGYSYTSTELELPVVEKTVEGNVPEGNDKTFTFEIKSAEGEENPMPENTTATVTGSGEATAFGTIFYTEPGVYNYDIFEQELDESCVGYIKDDTVYRLTVTVKDIGGELSAEYVITDGENTADKLGFVNTYAPEAIETTAEVEKKVEGAVPETDETYTFELTAKDGAPVPENTKATVSGAGKASFDSWKYTEAGVYVYEVAEVKGESENCTYDSTVYTVTDTVTDNDGVLELSRVITKGDEEVEEIEFVNTYTETETGGSSGGDNPQTSDSNTILPMILMLLAAAAVLPVSKMRIRKEAEDD